LARWLLWRASLSLLELNDVGGALYERFLAALGMTTEAEA